MGQVNEWNGYDKSMANFGDFLKPEVCGKTVLP